MAGSKTIPKLPHWEQIVLDRFKDIRDHPDFDEDMQKVYSILNANDLMNEDEFLHDLKANKVASRDTQVMINLRRLLNKYEAPGGMYELLREYLVLMGRAQEDGLDIKTIDEASLLSYLSGSINTPPLFLVCLADGSVLLEDERPYNTEAYEAFIRLQGGKRVYIELTANVQKDDLIDYINQNYDKIEAKLDLIAPGRVKRATSKLQTKRDYRIIRLYKELSNDPQYKRKVYKVILAKMNEGHKKETCSDDTIKQVIKHYKRQKKLWDVLSP